MGGIFGDDLFEDEIKSSKKSKVKEVEEDDEDEEEEGDGILDLTRKERIRAQKKLASKQMLFPEEEAEMKKKVKVRREKGESSRKVPEVSQDVLDQVGDALGEFDAETANKKNIRNLRKALQILSLARYPKKKKEKKEKKVKKSSKKEEVSKKSKKKKKK